MNDVPTAPFRRIQSCTAIEESVAELNNNCTGDEMKQTDLESTHGHVHLEMINESEAQKVTDFGEKPDAGSVPNKFGKQHSLQDLYHHKNKIDNRMLGFQRGRSNSDGAAVYVDNVEAFPSLPNTVLENLGLYGDVARERLNDESLEQKFTSLSLAFTIDAATIKDRCERQRRTRDQTESNFNLEVEKLKDQLAMFQPLCLEIETADLLSTLYSQVEILTKAASLVSIAAERYGAVQHEERLTESVHLMVSHVQALKFQRDSARRQLQYTKRVLQEPVQSVGLNSNNQKSGLSGLNKKLITKRRASTDSVHLTNHQLDPSFKLNRRLSDLPFRASLAKTRPCRLELGMELNKIKEISLPDDGFKDDLYKPQESPTSDLDSDSEINGLVSPGSHVEQCDDRIITDMSNILRFKLVTCLEDIQRKLTELFKKWSKNGYLYAFLNSCAVLCFSVSILTLVSIFLEQDYTIKGSTFWIFPWMKKN